MDPCPSRMPRCSASARPHAPGSRRPSPSRPRRRTAPGRRSRAASTRWWSLRPARARRCRRSSGPSTGCSPSRRRPSPARCRVLYVSPLKALAVDVERNLRAPLDRHPADRRAPGRRRCRRSASASARATPRPRSGAPWPARPPDILITTPESLFLMLTCQARESLRARRDGDRRRGPRRRGHQARRPPRAQPRAPRRPARPSRRSGSVCPPRSGRSTRSRASSAARRPVEVVAPPSAKQWDLKVVVPVEDMTAPAPYDDSDEAAGDGREAHLDLAPCRGARGRPDRAAPLDHRLRQLAPPRRAAHRPAQRDRRRARRDRRLDDRRPGARRDHGPVGRVLRRRRR